MQIPELLLSRILIVDDNHSNIEILKELLELKGYSNIKTTTKPLEAEALIVDYMPNLLILDLMMPELSGYELMERLKSNGLLTAYMPVLVLTADATYEAKKQALQGGASDFLTKPFDLTEVDLRIKNLLSNVYLMNALKMKNLGLSETVKEKSQELDKSYESLKVAKELAESNELKYRTLFDSNKDFICLLELQEDHHKCAIRELNETSLELTGYSRMELLGKPYMNLEANPNDSKFDQITSQLKAGGQASFETIFKRKDGKYCNVEAKAVMVEISGQKLVLMIFRDITERVKFIEEITRQNNVLRDIAWSQSHLVRAPLARLMGLVNLLDPIELDNHPDIDLIPAIKQSADELDAIIHDIADKTYIVNQSVLPDLNIIDKENSKEIVQKPDFHVLIVDDDKMIQLLQKAVIMRNNFHPKPEFASNGQEALDILLANDNQDSTYLVLLDINMPVMTGWEFLDGLNQLNLKATIQVVIMTSSVDMQDKIRASSYPLVVDYMSKPIGVEQINQLRENPRLSVLFQS